jgi:hypothetical protein
MIDVWFGNSKVSVYKNIFLIFNIVRFLILIK